MSAAITLWIAKNWSSIQKPTPDLANRLLTADERVKFWLIDLHCVTFILLVNINEYINRHLCWNYAHPSVATTGWLWIQDFSRNKPKHLYWLDTWHFSTEYCVHYYCKLIMSMKFIINTHTYPIHISLLPSFFGELVVRHLLGWLLMYVTGPSWACSHPSPWGQMMALGPRAELAGQGKWATLRPTGSQRLRVEATFSSLFPFHCQESAAWPRLL